MDLSRVWKLFYLTGNPKLYIAYRRMSKERVKKSA